MSGTNYICKNPECPEVDIDKPSLGPIEGVVICGACGQDCTDNGPVVEP